MINFISSINKNLANKKNLAKKISDFNARKKSYINLSFRFYCKHEQSSVFFSLYLKDLLNKSVSTFLPLSILFSSYGAMAIPETNPQQNIIDESGNLTKSSVSYIEKSLLKIKETTQIEVYFISVRNLPYGTDPQEYAKNLFEKWGLGDKDVVVVLVNKLSKAGIFYGSQISGLTDEIVQSICNETYTLKAKDEQYSSAALDVNNRLVSILLGKGDPGSPLSNRVSSSSNFKSAKKTEESRSKYIAIIAILLVIAFVVPMIQFFYYVKDE